MGITYIDGIVKGKSAKAERLTFLVDSGASYTLLPEKTCKALKLAPTRRMAFSLADGTRIERDLSECHIEIEGVPHAKGHTPVIIGVKGDQPLLGAITLEIFGLVLNPFSRELQPMQAMLANTAHVNPARR